MTTFLNEYGDMLKKKSNRTTSLHNDRAYLHKMSKEDIKKHYAKYFSEEGNIECCSKLNKEFEKIDLADLEMYENWLMESD
jgi:hypothetical protein